MMDQDLTICSAVAVAIALEELDRIKAVQCLPTPEQVLQRLEARSRDFDMVAGIVAAYLRRPRVAA